MTSKLLAKKIALSALGKKANDIVIMDLRKATTMTDFFVVCSGDSDTQVKAIADAVREAARLEGENVWKNEGYSDASWILLDFVNVVVHVFHKQTREFYNLEKLWGDAKVEHVSDSEPEERPSGRRKKTIEIDGAETPEVNSSVKSEAVKPAPKKRAPKAAAGETAATKKARTKKKKADTEE